LQQKYGAPANLPKKPPPSQVSSSFDVEHIINTAPSHGPSVPGSTNNGNDNFSG
jgi:hypothetical protein